MSAYDITPGVLDASAERAFTYGACCGLAVALHDATGWPLIKVTDADSVYPSGDDEDALDGLVGRPAAERGRLTNVAGVGVGGLHWLVAHPSGKLLDVDGLHDVDDVLDRYDGEGDERSQGEVALGVSGRADAIDEYVDAKGEPVALAVCATFVPSVLARAGA